MIRKTTAGLALALFAATSIVLAAGPAAASPGQQEQQMAPGQASYVGKPAASEPANGDIEGKAGDGKGGKGKDGKGKGKGGKGKGKGKSTGML